MLGLELHAGWWWAIGGAILLILEVLAPGFFLMFVGAAAIVTGLVTIALDALWGTVELGDAATVIGIGMLPFLVMLTFILDFVAVFSIQRFVARDGLGSAFAKALVMAVLAGVPFMVMGTAAGAFLLGWAGLSNLTNRVGDGKR